jgi:two-component system KDP operon response regulator KdpE
MSKTKILIVEDDADVCLGYQVLLKANHYDTCFAVDSLTAASEASKHHPDLIILDLGLPAGDWQGDGFVVLGRLMADTDLAGVPVLVVSGRDVGANRERALKAGARAYLQKPWDDSELLAIIKQLTAEPARSVR